MKYRFSFDVRGARGLKGREGGALVMALITIMMATLFAASVLQVSSMITKRQAHQVDNVRAFYLAEAGLSEAFEAVRTKRRGQVGSMAAPATYGDGLLWVDAAPMPDGQIQLKSTAICGKGVSTLALIIEPTEVPLGIFSDEDLIVDTVLLVDSFDSTQPLTLSESYELTIDPEDPTLCIDDKNDILFYQGAFYHYTHKDGNSYDYDHVVTTQELSEDPTYGDETQYDIDFDDFVDDFDTDGYEDYYEYLEEGEYEDDEDFQEIAPPVVLAGFGGNNWNADFVEQEYDGVLNYFETILQGVESSQSELVLPDTPSIDVSSEVLGSSDHFESLPETEESNLADAPVASASESVSVPIVLDSGKAVFGSNGDVVIGGAGESVKIHGDVVPGVGKAATIGSDSSVSGSTDPRLLDVELPEVEVPTLTMESAVVQDSPIPMILTSGSSGYLGIEVAADAELIIRGPATLVVGELSLGEGAVMTLDTTDGDVEIFVTGSMALAPGSEVFTPSHMPGELSVQVSADDRASAEAAVQLRAQSRFFGTIYAPDAEVEVGGDFELFGSIAARVLDLEPGAKLHYDSSGSEKMPSIVSWKIIEVPAQAKTALSSFTVQLGVDTASLEPLSEAHDLGGITLAVRYTDKNGVCLTYEGPEEDFDWSTVAEVEDVSRQGWDDWEQGWSWEDSPQWLIDWIEAWSGAWESWDSGASSGGSADSSWDSADSSWGSWP